MERAFSSARATLEESFLSVAAARRQSVVTRLVLGALLALFCWLFQGDFALAVGWFALVVATQLADLFAAARLLDAPSERRKQAAWAMTATTTVAALVWSVSFVILWTYGGAYGKVVAALSCAGSMLHVAVVCYHAPRLFWLMIGPYAFVLIVPLVLASIAQGDVALLRGAALLTATLGFVGNFFASYRQLRAMTMRVEDARAEAERGRAEADRANAAKSEFLATMSHELRTPLNAVIGYAELLEEELESDGKGRSVADAKRIGHAGRHLLAMINNVLDLSKIEAGHFEVRPSHVPLAQFLAELAATLEHSACANGNVLRVVCEAPDTCVIDETLLRQCLLNLLGNANKFTRNGKVTLRARRAAETLVFEVCDTGIGMSAEQVEKLFQPFVQGDASLTRQFGGTGLGLAITKRLAGLLGGDVNVHSAPGAGATFTLSVWAPLAAARRAA